MDALEDDPLFHYFLPRLLEAWDGQSVGSGQVDDDRYVQWAGSELGLQIECVSNRFLEGASRLSEGQVKELRRRGWHDPLGDDLPNHWQVFVDREDVGRAARALVDVVHLLRSPAPDLAGVPLARRPARSVVVVPVGKVSTCDVLDGVLGSLGGMSDPVALDLFGLAARSDLVLPMASTATVLDAGEHLTYPLLLDSGLIIPDGLMDRLLTAAGDLLRLLQRLRTAGRDAVVVGPRLLPPYQWLYAAVLAAAADAVVLLLDEPPDDPLPRQLLDVVLPALRDTAHLAVLPSGVGGVGSDLPVETHVVEKGDDPARDRDAIAVLVHALCQGRALGEPKSGLRSPPLVVPRRASGMHEDDGTVPEAWQEGTRYIEPGIVCSSKTQFADLLREWLNHEDHGMVLGEPAAYGGKALVRVLIGGRGFHLNGDTRATGVEAYLRLVDAYGADLTWRVIPNAGGRINKVALGDDPKPLRYFYLYADEASPVPYDL
jgi:hypothetical protein